MIPKIFHFAWGNDPQPPHFSVILKSWKHFYPDYEIHVWTPDELTFISNQRDYLQAPNPTAASNIARYDIVYQKGGIWLDCDIIATKRFDFELTSSRCLLCMEKPERKKIYWVSDAIIGAEAGDPFLKLINAEIVRKHLPRKYISYIHTGPTLVTQLALKYPKLINCISATTFHPGTYNEFYTKAKPDRFDYGIHFFNSASHFLQTGIPKEWITFPL